MPIAAHARNATDADQTDIRFVAVTKRFGDIAAVDGVSFAIVRGKSCGGICPTCFA